LTPLLCEIERQPKQRRSSLAAVSNLPRGLPAASMARVAVVRALPLAARLPLGDFLPLVRVSYSAFLPSSSSSLFSEPLHFPSFFTCRSSEAFPRARAPGWPVASVRGFRKTRRRPVARKNPSKERQLELDVKICLEEELPDDPEILSIAEILRLNAPMAMKIAFDELKDSDYKTRDRTINDVGNFEKVELSIMLCNDYFIQKLNKDWCNEDHATDVLSMSQHIPGFDLPILMLGDIVISVETAARQAEERGHSLVDEIRILLVHGLLHLLGFDHEVSDEAEAEMEKEEEVVLKSLGWKGWYCHPFILYPVNFNFDLVILLELERGGTQVIMFRRQRKKAAFVFISPNLNIFCDMDGTLLNSKSQITPRNAVALREAISRGVKAFLYSLEHRVPLIGFSQDRCVTLFDDPLIESLHTVYFEPRAEVMPSVEDLLRAKLLFYGTAESVSTSLRPHWSEAVQERARVVQAQADMLEIVPPGTSKGEGVRMLLDHLGAKADEVT
ncbi:Endoribonuclease, partial [Nymphaea thermarum]